MTAAAKAAVERLDRASGALPSAAPSGSLAVGRRRRGGGMWNLEMRGASVCLM